MSMIEQLRYFHSYAGQIVYVEKPAIVDIVRGNPEVSGAPRLFGYQGVQPRPSFQLSLSPIECLQGFADVRKYPRISATGGELLLQAFRSVHSLRMLIGKIRERIAEPFELACSITDDDPVIPRTNG